MRTNPAPDQVGIGVIGAGMMGAHHIRTLATAISGGIPVAVSDADPRRAADTGCTAFEDPYALIADDSVDAVLIASSDETHEQFVMSCLDAGKPVLCEKPLSLSAESCLKLVHYENGRGLINVGFMRRFDPSYVRLRETLDSGVLGTALMAHCAHRNVDVPPYFTGEVSIVSSAVHEFDALRWLFGQEITAVTVHTPTHSSLASPQLRDPLLIVAQLAGGAIADIEIFVNARYGYDVRCEVVGERGTVQLRPPAGITTRLERQDGTEVPGDFRTWFAAAYRNELQAWVDGLRGAGPQLATAWDGYASLAVAEAATVSARSGGTVAVQLADVA